MKQHIPNLITLLNLLLGCVAVVCIFEGNLSWVPWLVMAAALADFADGLAARLLKVSSPLGLQLDSLADMVTFGLVPGATMFQLLKIAYAGNEQTSMLWYLPGFLLTLFSALRLAKFNIDSRQTDHFIGLPTPSNTLFVTSLIWVWQQNKFGMGDFLMQPALLYGIILLFSYLLVAEIPLFSNKLKHFRIRGNEIRLIFVFSSLLLICLLSAAGIALAIIWYIILSIVSHYFIGDNISKK